MKIGRSRSFVCIFALRLSIQFSIVTLFFSLKAHNGCNKLLFSVDLRSDSRLEAGCLGSPAPAAGLGTSPGS